MTTTTVTSGRILRGQLQGKTGEESILAMDEMSYTGFSKVSSFIVLSIKIFCHFNAKLNFFFSGAFYKTPEKLSQKVDLTGAK